MSTTVYRIQCTQVNTTLKKPHRKQKFTRLAIKYTVKLNSVYIIHLVVKVKNNSPFGWTELVGMNPVSQKKTWTYTQRILTYPGVADQRDKRTEGEKNPVLINKCNIEYNKEL